MGTFKKKNTDKRVDPSELGEIAIPNSRSRKKVEHKDAISALDHAKSMKRKGRFAKQGESEFSRELAKLRESKPDLTDLFSIKESAEYLGIRNDSFSQRSRKYELPFEKIRGKKYFKQETLDDHKENTIFKLKL